jgi:non-heme chloroperoxidase
MLAFNMMVPPKVCANMGGRTLSMDETLKALNLPMLVTHGAADKLILVALGAAHNERGLRHAAK